MEIVSILTLLWGKKRNHYYSGSHRETKEEDVKNSPWQPDFIFTSLEEINNHLK